MVIVILFNFVIVFIIVIVFFVIVYLNSFFMGPLPRDTWNQNLRSPTQFIAAMVLKLE